MSIFRSLGRHSCVHLWHLCPVICVLGPGSVMFFCLFVGLFKFMGMFSLLYGYNAYIYI